MTASDIVGFIALGLFNLGYAFVSIGAYRSRGRLRAAYKSGRELAKAEKDAEGYGLLFMSLSFLLLGNLVSDGMDVFGGTATAVSAWLLGLSSAAFVLTWASMFLHWRWVISAGESPSQAVAQGV